MPHKKHPEIKNIKDPVLVIDLKGRIVKASPAVRTVTGHAPKEMKGRFIASFFADAADAERVLRALRESLSQRIVAIQEFRHRHKSGKDFWAEIIIVPVTAGASGKGTLQCLLRDVTRHREADQCLQKAFAMRAQFTDTVSHELRTPLSVIQESVAILLGGHAGVLTKKQKHFLSLARSNIERLGKLISETLDLRALEEGRQELHIRENSLGEILAEVEKSRREAARKKGLGLIVSLAPGLPRINFDREKILECLRILVDCAIRMSRKGDIVIQAAFNKNTVRISVQDCSVRKPGEDLPNWFLRFEPLIEEEKIKLGRTGLELARVKEIVEKHRGKIWAEPVPGAGTTFHLLLPVWEKRSRV